MTPEEEAALLRATAADLDDDLRAAFVTLVGMIQSGSEPRAAVFQVMESFAGEMADTLQTAMGAILGMAIGEASAIPYEISRISLSTRVYAEAADVAGVVQTIVRQHTAGFQDARNLARDLFEGYGFREPGDEPLQINPRNPRLPQYLRRAIVTDPVLSGGIERALAQLQVNDLSTPGLRAAYSEALAAIDALETGPGRARLERRLEIAFYERVRYFADRIARTELHRAYSEREARILLDDADVEFVQIRRGALNADPCICSLMTGRNLYGLGTGVYPKRDAPVPPYHPFCRCVMSPWLDLTGRKAGERDDDGDAYFINRLDPSVAGRVMGSQAKADLVRQGAAAEDVASAGRDPAYRIRRMGEVR